MFQNNPWRIGAAVVFVTVVGGAIWFLIAKENSWTSGGTATTTNDVSAAIAELLATGATSTRGDGFTVEIEPKTPATVPSPPSLSRPVPAMADRSTEARAIITGRIEASIAALKENPRSYADWVDLGAHRHSAKDYVGAKEAWEYAAILGPNTVTPFGNLGDLYTFYLKDYAKAEANLKTAIANDSKNSARYYRTLHELYTIWKPNTDAPAQALKDGIKAFPDALDLHVLLARHYKEKGRTTESRAAYEVAISVATRAGNTEAATQLRAEKP